MYHGRARTGVDLSGSPSITTPSVNGEEERMMGEARQRREGVREDGTIVEGVKTREAGCCTTVGIS